MSEAKSRDKKKELKMMDGTNETMLKVESTEAEEK